MEHLISQIFSETSGAWSYGLVLLVLLICGLGIPLPEDLVLISGGFLVCDQGLRLDVMMVIAFVGILGGDSIAFGLGRRLGEKLTRRWPFRFILTPSKREEVERLFKRYGDKIIVIARFMPGVRAVTYFCAGTSGMKYSRFIIFDGLAATVSAPVFVYLGYRFGKPIVGAVRQGQWIVLLAVAALAGLALLTRYWRQRAAVSKRPTPALPQSLPLHSESLPSIETADAATNENKENPDAVKSRRLSARPPAI